MRMDDLLREIRSRYEASGAVLRETEEGQPVLQSVVAASRAVVSSMSGAAKRRLAYERGVPEEGSGQPGAWQPGDENRVLVVPLSDETPDRHGTIILSDGWDFAAWDANPVYLAQHESWAPPIGLGLKRTRGRITGPDGKTRKGHNAHVLYSREDLNPLAETYYRNRVAGRLKMTSVGFVPTGWRRITKKEADAWGADGDLMVIETGQLLELSDVTVGSNPSMVGRDFAIACVRACAQTPLFGREDLATLYGADAVAAAGVDVVERSSDLDWDAIMRAAGQIEAAVTEQIEVVPVDVEDVPAEASEAFVPLDGDRKIEVSLTGQDVEEMTALFREALDEPTAGDRRTIQVDGIEYVPLADLEAAERQSAAAVAAAELLQLAFLSGSEQPDHESRTDAWTVLLCSALDPIKEQVAALRTEVQALADARTVTPAPDSPEPSGDDLQDPAAYGRLLDLADGLSAKLNGAKRNDESV